MLRSFYVALTGLKGSKDWLDITSDNVANANTIGFKRSRPVFQNLVLQNIIGYNAYSGTVNHTTFGGGVLTAMTQTIFTTGPFKETGINTDIAIDGKGFLVLRDNSGREFYTRDGQLRFAERKEGNTTYMYLVHNSGLNVMAYDISQLQGSENATGCPRLSPVKFKVEIEPKATTEIRTQEGANLDPRVSTVTQTFDPSNAETYNTTYTLQAFDSQGRAHDISVFFVKLPAVTASDGSNTYYVSIDDSGNLYYVKGDNTYAVDKSSSEATVDETTDEIITIRQGVKANGGTYDLVYDKTQGKYCLKDASGKYYELITTDTAYTPKGNALRLDNLWQTYILGKDANGNWVDFETNGLNDNSGFKFNILAFDENGAFYGLANNTLWTPTGISTQKDIDFTDPTGVLKNLSKWSFEGITSYPVDFSLGFNQDGYPPGRLQSVNIGTDGTITAVYNNGVSKNLYRLALAYFNDDQVLTPEGGNIFSISATQNPLYECAGVRSQIRSGTLELSNVDIAEEMINMITAEKAYQANAKVIQTGQTILDTTINLKR